MKKKILLQIARGEQNIKSPYHVNGWINYNYVMHDPISRLGFLVAWCTETGKGFWISRVEIPIDAKHVKSENEVTFDLSSIKLISWALDDD